MPSVWVLRVGKEGHLSSYGGGTADEVYSTPGSLYQTDEGENSRMKSYTAASKQLIIAGTE